MSNHSEENARFVTCRCQICNGAIEFDSNELDGRETAQVECPHCTLETSLFVSEQNVPPVISESHLRQISDVTREDLLRRSNAEQIGAEEGADQAERLTPNQFSDFIGQ